MALLSVTSRGRPRLVLKTTWRPKSLRQRRRRKKRRRRRRRRRGNDLHAGQRGNRKRGLRMRADSGGLGGMGGPAQRMNRQKREMRERSGLKQTQAQKRET